MGIDNEKDSDILKAMAHPVRLRMIRGLLAHECNVNSIVGELGLPQSTVSQHLAILKSRGIIAAKKDGVRTCYRVIDKRVAALVKVLDSR
ncbi:MAG: metalloregulator ArsR/SmtB family transcription factor [Candidatus Omnitrophica bacterium]|nr:metalloregulator ArsR/SmtB family transcription factor [Candidatus Omnitrophota bacterium]MDD5487823.1 metalloregulator ArsR/SmtB family transcription factor [Candidatus Omnitrophota bacterium]